MEYADLSKLVSAFAQARIVQTAVKMGVFDTIEKAPCSFELLAEAIGAEPRAAEIFLNSLTALDLLEKRDGIFHNAPIASRYLVKGAPDYYGDMILFEEMLWDVWGDLEQSVRTGKPAREPDMFQGEEGSPEGSPDESTVRFIMAMHSLVSSRGDADVVAPHLGLESVGSLLDVGSGPGTFPISFRRKYPSLEVAIFDLPGTLRVTRKVLAAEGMEDAVKLYEGDYLTDELPGGFDMVFMSNIVHSEDEETNRKLVRKIRDSLNVGGRVAIKDHFMDDSRVTPPLAAVFSVQMLLVTKGRDYSFAEARAWLEEAGFKNIEWIRLEDRINASLIIAEKD